MEFYTKDSSECAIQSHYLKRYEKVIDKTKCSNKEDIVYIVYLLKSVDEELRKTRI